MKKSAKTLGSLKEFMMLIILILMIVILSFLSPNFAKFNNFINIFKQTAINGILAVGMGCVILTGGFDLSVGSIVGLSGVIAALLAQGDTPIIIPIVCAIGIGGLSGLLNGGLVAYLNIPAFVVTLGTQNFIRGLTYIASGGKPVFGVNRAYERIAGTNVANVPLLVIYYLIIVLLFAFILQKTVYGRHIYTVGGNADAASVSGINVKRIKLSVYMIAGLLSGVAGMLLTSRTVSGSPTTGDGYELDAIAAVVIGGFSLDGGVGKWYGMLIGALVLSVLSNGLDIMGVASYYQYLIKGVIMIIAVYFDVRGRAKMS